MRVSFVRPPAALSGVAVAVAVAIGGLVAPGLAGAQGATAGAPDEVVVVSKRLEESLPQELAVSGSRVTTVTADDIARGGFNDMGQTLQYSVPGLYVAPNSGQFSYVEASLQGSRPGDILWLVDGVRINNRLYTSTMPLDTIPAHMVERVEVLEGGQGLFYGSPAVAGVVNVITKDFSEQVNSEFSVGADTNDGKHASGYLRGPVGGSRFVVYGSVDKADGFQPFRDRDYQASATDRERGFDVRSGGVKFLHDFSDAVRLSATYQHTNADLELLTPQLVAKNVNSRNEDLASVKLDVNLSDRVDLYVKGYYHDWDTRYTTLNNSLTDPGTIEVDSDNLFWGFHDYGANALVRLKLNKGFEYFAGYDLQKYGGEDEVLLIADRNEQTQAFFAQVRTTEDLVEHLNTSFGVRYNTPSDAPSATVWTATAKYDIAPNLFVRGVVGTSFKLPSAEELYAIDPFELGNPNLRPEKSKNLNLSIGGGVGLGSRRLNWEAVGFARDVTNLIDFFYDEAQDLDIAANVPGTVKVRGGELALSAALSSAVNGRVSYTQSTSKDANGKQIQRIPKSLAQAALSYQAPSGHFGADVAVNHVGDVFTAGVGGDVPYGDYTLVDISGRYFIDSARRHRLGVRLENAFDEEYGRVGRGRTDFDSSPYNTVMLGTPRSWHVTYTFSY